jgi:hypothetical protein
MQREEKQKMDSIFVLLHRPKQAGNNKREITTMMIERAGVWSLT